MVPCPLKSTSSTSAPRVSCIPPVVPSPRRISIQLACASSLRSRQALQHPVGFTTSRSMLARSVSVQECGISVRTISRAPDFAGGLHIGTHDPEFGAGALKNRDLWWLRADGNSCSHDRCKTSSTDSLADLSRVDSKRLSTPYFSVILRITQFCLVSSSTLPMAAELSPVLRTAVKTNSLITTKPSAGSSAFSYGERQARRVSTCVVNVHHESWCCTKKKVQVLHDDTNYGPYCEFFFFLVHHETDPTEPVSASQTQEQRELFCRPAGSFASRQK